MLWLSGVRSDVAVKVFGDDMQVMNSTAEDISHVLAGIQGGEDVKVEQTTGLPILTVNIDRQKVARLGVNLADVQETIAIAMNGYETGTLFQGDRRFQIVVRLAEEARVNMDTFKRLLRKLIGFLIVCGRNAYAKRMRFFNDDITFEIVIFFQKLKYLGIFT